MANQIDFSKEASLARLLNNLQEEPLFKKVSDSSVAASFLKAIAKENELNVQGIVIAGQEASWSSASNVTSLLAKAEVLSYVPHRKVGSIGRLLLSTGENFDQANIYPYPIDIPFGTLFSSSNLKFTNTESYVIPANHEATNSPFEIPIVQGYPQVVNYVSPVTEDYATISIKGNSIEDRNIFVTVNGVPWTKVNSLRDSIAEADTIFTVSTLPNELGIDINFGNEVYGKRLNLNDEVRITYLITEGVQGNILSSDIITNVDDIIYDSQGNEVSLICTNSGAITGGKDYEDKESIRRNAPSFQQTKNSLTSKPDYENFLNSEEFPYLDKVVVWGASEINEDNNNAPGTYISIEANNIYIAGISFTGQQATEYETILRTLLEPKKGPTVLIKIVEINVIYVVFHVEAFIRDGSYTLKTVKDNITAILQDTYSLKKMDFREDINNSQFVAAINSANGLHHHITTLTYFIENTLKGLTTPIAIYMESLTPLSVNLYFKHSSDLSYSLVAVTSTSTQYVENIVGVDDYTGLISGSIDLRFGVGSFSILEGSLPYSLEEYSYRLDFGTESTDALLMKRNQILTFGEAIIDAKYDEVY